MNKKLVSIILLFSLGGLVLLNKLSSKNLKSNFKSSDELVMKSIGVPERVYSVHNYVYQDKYLNAKLQSGVSDWILQSSNMLILEYLNPESVIKGEDIPQQILETMEIVKEKQDYYVMLSVGGFVSSPQFRMIDCELLAKNLAKIAIKYNVGIEISINQGDDSQYAQNIERLIKEYRKIIPYGTTKMSQVLTAVTFKKSTFVQNSLIQLKDSLNWITLEPEFDQEDYANRANNYWDNIDEQIVDNQTSKIVVGNFVKASCSNQTDVDIALNYKFKGNYSTKGVSFFFAISPKTCQLYGKIAYCGLYMYSYMTSGDGSYSNPQCDAINQAFYLSNDQH
ncbi:hypothetical protein TTHERM_00120800 (macronuclear) [Tetrahymena thermophila SB210]|uniref:Uncharacterized protein n=1 Tax=Tetrahymena thermophila (strain SB210) TaxID=312017 RepID=Q22YY7_TETTS|nr:hypothetical protein TTHERM_00120800 [Tetrahymena thermophila SB210]EAR90534.1 hypothetical protein TTHERM_00120800 [Tetrahymena thermophila SB210]|eukprot:XP_001010779.1 hypothetical protein TTHERM_00120800 [Tetrahymena thermophila SB210]